LFIRDTGVTPRTNILVIRHRCNSIADLAATKTYYGVEIDIRSKDETLVLAHDPFSPGESFSDWIEHYRHRFIVLNVKEEGLEEAVLGVLGRHGVEDFFFLDQSFPFLLKTAAGGERRCAVRTSEYESVETALAVAHLVDWVWLDTFTGLALTGSEANALKKAGLKLCLVSPELVGRTGVDEVRLLRERLALYHIDIDAVCTKQPDAWKDWPGDT
jgi:hypothetical protein